MNNGLLTAWRQKQLPWWSEQDAANQILKNLWSIGISGDQLNITDGSSYQAVTGGRNIAVSMLPVSQLIGINVIETINTDQNITAIYGFNFQPQVFGAAGTIGTMGAINTLSNASIGSTVTTLLGIRISLNCQFGTVATAIGVDVRSNDLGTNPTTTIGLRIGVTAALTGATVWGMQVGNYQSYHQGPLMVGDASAPATSAGIELKSTTKALLVSRMTTAQKNALTAVAGMIVYDSDLGKFQGYQAGAWTSFA